MVGPCTCCNTGGALTDDSGILVPTLVVSHAPTPALASALSLPGRYTNKDLQRATKLVLELFVKDQEHSQLQPNSAPYKQLVKVWFSELYYENSHLDCYHFCQQCKGHFKTARINRPNQIFFATSFLYRAIVQQKHQQKPYFKTKDQMT